VVGWFAVGALLNYIPTDFQIHMLNSWQIPMMILATKGLYGFVALVIGQWKLLVHDSQLITKSTVSRLVLTVFLLAVLPTNVYLWTWRFVDLSRHDYPFYLHRDDIAALHWLRENSSADDIVLSSLTIGQYVPAVSGNTAFLAHWAQTVSFYDKRDRVIRFFDVITPDEERVETIHAFGVDYVFYGPAERELGGFDPSVSEWLELVYAGPYTQLYRVKSAG